MAASVTLQCSAMRVIHVYRLQKVTLKKLGSTFTEASTGHTKCLNLCKFMFMFEKL